MSVERLSRGKLGGLSEDHVTQFIESDFKIRSGCGLLTPNEYGQECVKCWFTTNKMADVEPRH